MQSKLEKGVFLLCVLLCANFARASGVITCETPNATGVVLLVENGPEPADDVALARIEEDTHLPVAKVVSLTPGDGLFDCLMGPIPPVDSISGTTTSATGQAYVEHGLSEDSVWGGIRLDIVLDAPAANATRTDVSVLAVDFDTPTALSEQFRINIERAADGSNPQLVVTLAGATASEVGRLALSPAGQSINVTWPTTAAPGQAFAVDTGSGSISAGLSAESRPRAVRLGYLAVNAAAGSTGTLFLRNPELLPE